MIEFNEGMDALKVFVRCAIFIVAPLALLFVLQSDLGTTVICLVAIFAILILGGVPARGSYCCSYSSQHSLLRRLRLLHIV